MSLPLETADADRSSSLAAAVDAAITSALTEQRLVGTVVLIARDGEIVHRRAAGLADRENGLAMTQPYIYTGDSFDYAFTPPDAGTFWYHPHCNTLTQMGHGMPFVTIENVDRVDATHIIIGNDNNLPFSAGRAVDKADNNEFSLLEVGEFLNAK